MRFHFSALLTFLATGLSAQTVVPSGTTTTETQVNGEVVEVAPGTTVNVNGAPAVALSNNDSVLNNQGTLTTQGVTSTVDSSANNTTINNQTGGILQASSRVVDITAGSGAVLNNAGGATILGTGNQRNGTVYVDSDTNDVSINNDGTIDAGVGNEGSGVGFEIAAEGNAFTIDNSGTIQGRGNASAALNTAGDGIRIGNVGYIGTASTNFTNTGTIASE